MEKKRGGEEEGQGLRYKRSEKWLEKKKQSPPSMNSRLSFELRRCPLFCSKKCFQICGCILGSVPGRQVSSFPMGLVLRLVNTPLWCHSALWKGVGAEDEMNPQCSERAAIFHASVTLTAAAETFWRRQWHPTPVLLPGKSHGRRSLVGCSPWGR